MSMKILRVDMTTRKTWMEDLPTELREWGNRGLIAKLLLREVPATCEPLGPRNKLILTGGPLAGFNLSSADRLSAGGKSPLTGGIKEANAGGEAARLLSRLGLRAIVVEGQAPAGELYLLKIEKDSAHLLRADNFRGMGNYALVERLRTEYGEGYGTITIGPAGERLYASAAIAISDVEGQPSRFAARGGLGAVMGAKGLKAILISASGDYHPPVADPIAFQTARREYHQALRNTPQTAEIYPKYGTAAVLPVMNRLGGLPTRNFTEGAFEKAQDLSGETLHDLLVERDGEGTPTHACQRGCIIRCSNIFADPQGKAVVSPLEYETLALLGSNLGIGSLDDVARLNYLCNDYGVDTIEVGAALGVAMSAGLLSFGDVEAAVNALHELGKGTVFGRVIGQGTVVTARVLGVTRIPAVKGQALPAHEPRVIKSMGVTYALGPQGADHTQAIAVRQPVDHSKPEGQVELSRRLQINQAAYDTLGFCVFTTPAVSKDPSLVINLLNAAYGTHYPPEHLQAIGREVLRTERAFNVAAGLGSHADKVPDWLRTEPLPPTGLVFDVSEEEMARFWDEV